ncbi:MAG: KpsF/GutQ family sugar-phosphate isomerase [Elusimicrobia bacterium]|nr:KpsF/GutQ family sugar-phosphate isomerase [Elusimicrobiota bacterium]
MILKQAKQVLEIEYKAIKDIIPKLDKNFEQAVEIISACRGRVIVTGIGKSGLVGRKISATLASTGTPSFFLHPTEGAHGDVGMVMKGDIILAISYSGENEELLNLLPVIKGMGLKLVTITGASHSTMSRSSDIALNVKVNKEACPYNLAPTASTTATMALGDALAISLLLKKGFQKRDFAALHPGGILGRKLLLKVGDIMRTGKNNPVINERKTVKEALLVMTASRLGAVNVIDLKGKLVGFFTDGDLRRHLQQGEDILFEPISKIMTRQPFTITSDRMATEAARIMQERNFDNIPVVDEKNYPLGLIDERDLLAKGLG